MHLKVRDTKRIVVASSALSMDVNFPDVRYVVICSLPTNLLDIHQEAGRAGRDQQPADVVITFHGQQLAHCEDDVKTFLKTEGCYRIAGYKPFDKDIEPVHPLHNCCNLCGNFTCEWKLHSCTKIV